MPSKIKVIAGVLLLFCTQSQATPFEEEPQSSHQRSFTPSSLNLGYLPAELAKLQEYIFKFLDPQSLYQASCVNKQWREIAHSLIQEHCKKDMELWENPKTCLQEAAWKREEETPYETQYYLPADFSLFNASTKLMVEISRGDLGEEEGHALESFLSHAKTLRSVKLSGKMLNHHEEGFKFLAEGLKKNLSFTMLTLDRIDLTYPEWRMVWGILTKRKDLTSLKFNSSCNLVESLAPFVRFTNKRSKSSSLEDELQEFTLPNVHTLWIESYDLKEQKEYAEDVAFFIRALPHLKELRIRDAGFGKHWMRALSPTIEASRIYALDLKDNKIGNKGCKRLLQVLPSTQITKLILSNNKIGNKGLRLLPKALKQSPHLIHLDLKINKLNDKAAIYIKEALRETHSLQALNLSHNQIGDEGAIQIASSLESYRSLSSLNLSGNQIDKAGILEFLHNAPKNNKLHSINIGIGSDAILLSDLYILDSTEDTEVKKVPSLWNMTLNKILPYYPVFKVGFQ